MANYDDWIQRDPYKEQRIQVDIFSEPLIEFDSFNEFELWLLSMNYTQGLLDIIDESGTIVGEITNWSNIEELKRFEACDEETSN
jgi:hypothetical protein